MNILIRRIAALAALSITLAAAPAQAGRSCDNKPISAPALVQGLELAERSMRLLDASGHQVVILARAGQDLSKYGQRWSHLGFAYREADGRGGHAWRVLHKLNHCGTAESAIYRQGLGDFFLDDPWRYEAAYAAPAPEVQQKLMALLSNQGRALAMHHKPYSMVSHAWGARYQQSNQWVIETFAAAMEPTVSSRERAQAWLLFKGYQPAILRLGPLTRLGGRIGSANIAFDDHPPEKRFSDRIETVGADSVFRWLERAGLAAGAAEVR